jgi:repressor of nif and glnA expression
MKDILSEKTLEIIEKSEEPLETKEIQEKLESSLKNVTRTKVFYRLNILRGDGLIKGKFVGPGKGVWIWWSKTIFSKNKNKRGRK